MDRIQELLGHSDAQRQQHLVGYRVIADHGRSITFLISDGVMPDNEGRDYVVRMILRRAGPFRQAGWLRRAFSWRKSAASSSPSSARILPSCRRTRISSCKTVTAEEERFQRALSTGLSLLDGLMERLQAGGASVIPGEDAFRLWDTYGFPLDITRDVAQENGFSVDEDGYQAALEQQRRQSGNEQLGAAADVSVYVSLLEELRSRGLLDADGVAPPDLRRCRGCRNHCHRPRKRMVRLSNRPMPATRLRLSCRRRRFTSRAVARSATRVRLEFFPGRYAEIGLVGAGEIYAAADSGTGRPYRRSHQRHCASG